MRSHRSLVIASTVLAASVASTGCPSGSSGTTETTTPVARDPGHDDAVDSLADPREVHLSNIVQLTNGGENAEAYWSFDGTKLIFQTKRPPYGCDQIMTMPADGSAEPVLVSTGKGRTTCSYYLPGDGDIVYATTHHRDEACPPEPDRSKGYVWPLYDFDIVRTKADGSGVQFLTEREGYDAEATVCPVDGSIIFTSDRSGDLELYRMDADGSNVVQLTDTPGYDGGAFFSPDCTQIVWRASRPEGEVLADYEALLAENLVRPSKLEIFVADADGSNARQVTYLGVAAFAPYFHPSGTRILFSTNHGDPQGREFNIWAIDTDGTDLEQITFADGFDGFPMFSPDGTKLAFASNRNQAEHGETNVFVADWVESPPKDIERSAADDFADHVAYLADDAREGRGVGTQGLADAAEYIEKQLVAAGVEPAMGASGFRQEVEVVVGLERGDATALTVGKTAVAAKDFAPAPFSSSGEASGKTVAVGYGIVADDLKVDDYKRKRVKGKVVVVERRVPDGAPFDTEAARRRYSDLQYKAFTAKQRGARALIVVDPDEAPEFPALVPSGSDAGIPIVVVGGATGKKLLKGSHNVTVRVVISRTRENAYNIVGRISAGAANKLPGAVVIGAHYDHLGYGGAGSLEGDKRIIHNGADDNASGTAALIMIAGELAAAKAELRRDIYVVAFTAEELGLVGSAFFARTPPEGAAMDDVVAMINMDMVGRLRGDGLAVLGADSAPEWKQLIEPVCADARVACKLGGDGYGPSDHMSFYAAGVPVVHFFTGAHHQYHKASDDTHTVNAAGGARVAGIVAAVARATAGREGAMTYKKVAAPLPRGDLELSGASLGTIPAYGEGEDAPPGALLSDVRDDGPAARAGVTGGDRIVMLDGVEIRNLKDLFYVLQSARPNTTVPIVVERDGKRVTLKVTYGEPRRRK